MIEQKDQVVFVNHLCDGLTYAVWMESRYTRDNFSSLYTEVLHLLRNSSYEKQFREVRQLKNTLYNRFVIDISGREYDMSSQFLVFCEEELNRLQPRNSELEHLSANNPDLQDAADFVEQLSSMLKKGERVTFKLHQELSQKIDELTSQIQAADDGQKELKDKVDQKDKQIEKLTHLMLDTFDLLDIVAASTKQNAEKWARQIDPIITKALTMLEQYGIEELQVEGQLFDGRFMEAIGTVSPQETQRDLQKYAVYAVTQRGFRYAHSGQLIRRAKVITVL